MCSECRLLENGTYDIHEFGLTEMYCPEGERISFRLTAIVHIAHERTDQGWHELFINARDGDGRRVGPGVKQKFHVDGTEAGFFIHPYLFEFESGHGELLLHARVGDQIKTWPITVRESRE